MGTMLNRAGTVVWLSVLATVGTVPVVTGVAAWSAVARVLDEPEQLGVTARWFDAFRTGIRGTRRLSLLVGMLSVVAIADLAYALLLDTGPLRYPILAVGGATAVALLAVVPYLVEARAHTGLTGRPLLRLAAVLAGARPVVTIPLVLLGLVAGAACAMLLPFTPVILAAYVAIAHRAYRVVADAVHPGARSDVAP